MTISKGDFVEIDYIGRLKEDGKIFDLTSEDVAKKEGLYHAHETYGARIVCIGEKMLVKGLDAFLVGKTPGTYTVALSAEDAFGKKNPKLMKLVPLQMFLKEKIRPFPGLQVNMDGYMGVIRSVSGGRVIVDFNHPLAGRDVVYEVMVKRKVTDAKEKISAFLRTGLFGKDVAFSYEKGKLIIQMSMPEQMQTPVIEKLKQVIPEIRYVVFEKEKEKQPEKKTGDTSPSKATTPS